MQIQLNFDNGLNTADSDWQETNPTSHQRGRPHFKNKESYDKNRAQRTEWWWPDDKKWPPKTIYDSYNELFYKAHCTINPTTFNKGQDKSFYKINEGKLTRKRLMPKVGAKFFNSNSKDIEKPSIMSKAVTLRNIFKDFKWQAVHTG
jgi:hypothetical protein